MSAGSLTIWDLRQNVYPINLLDAHKDSVSEIQFHPSYPDQLFSCSTAGEIWQWANPLKSSILDGGSGGFFLTENVRNNMEVFSIMSKLHKPVNSLDVNKDRLVCGCDNEAIYLINDISLFN